MKLSINNFKSIRNLSEYELKPLTILSGVNSTGKSSFIQLLLLLKQTLQLDSTHNQLFLNGDLYQAANYLDVLTDKKQANKLKISFEFTKDEDILLSSDKRLTIFDSFETFSIKVDLNFDLYNNSIYIEEFRLTYILPTGDKNEQFVKFQTIKGKKNTFSVEANSLLFGNELWGTSPNITDLQYSSIFPNFYEITEIDVQDGTKKKQKIYQKNSVKYFPKIEGVKSLLEKKFSNMSYIGPLREQPKDEYIFTSTKRYVGKLGEFTAQVLENYGKEKITVMLPEFTENGVSYITTKTTLLKAVKFWMCDVFKIGLDIYAKKKGEAYTIYLKNNGGMVTTIKHVGFGISQILPIIVEGLIMPETGTLILEQPEIHLHPKVQSLLFDFLYSLILCKKNVIIETHSDHFITRMRRRIAEDPNNQTADAINLTFIEADDTDVFFEVLELNDMGTLDYFPSDFIEQSSTELKSIVKAQMRKRSNQTI